MRRTTIVRLTRSVRKYIRREKARIRVKTTDSKEVQRLIIELYARFGRVFAVHK